MPNTSSIPRPDIQYLPSPNYWPFNNGRKIICYHGTASPAPQALGWLRNPAAEASANFLVQKDGTIVCLVDPEKGYSAWANGIVNKPNMSNQIIAAALAAGNNLNTVSISIEHEADASDMFSRRQALTAAQEKASMQLTLWLSDRFAIPLDRQHMIGHWEVDSVNRPYCPGVIDLDGYVQKVNAMANAAKNEIQLNGHTVRGEILNFYRRLGDLALPVVGLPIGEEFVDPVTNLTTQFFEKSSLQYFPQYQGTNFVVQAKILPR